MPSVLSPVSRPFINSVNSRLIASPRPVPPNRREMELSAWANFWNSRSECSGRHADAGVFDLDADERGIGRIGFGAHLDLAVFSELDRVADQIDQNLAQPERIAVGQPLCRRIDGADQVQALFRGTRAQQAGSGAYRVAQMKVGVFQLDLAGFQLGDIQDVVDHRSAGTGRTPGFRPPIRAGSR